MLTKVARPFVPVGEWAKRAACAEAIAEGNAEPQWWFPELDDAGAPGGSYGRARAVCAGCSVQAECLAYALAIERPSERYGYWGGTTPKERAALARRRLPLRNTRDILEQRGC